MKKLPGSRIVLLCASVIIISGLSIITSLSVYNNIVLMLTEEKGKTAMNVSIAVSELIEQDYPSFKKLLASDNYEDGSYDPVYYAKTQQVFREIKEKTGVKYLYCGKRVSENRIVYIFDGEDPNSDWFSPLGSEDNLNKAEQEIYRNRTSGYTPIIDDPNWGKLLTGMTPILDPSTGEAVAHIGADVSANSIKTSLVDVRNVILTNALLFTVITGLIIFQMLRMTSAFMETDYLTGLQSKSFQDRFLKQQIKKSISSREQFPLIMIDFDDFKLINDKYGHQFGDLVLKSVSEIIKICTRPMDCSSRYGGDEFIIILPESDLEYAMLVCRWLQKEIGNLQLLAANDMIVSVSVSIGIALWEAEMPAEQILIRADNALYHAKKTGKNQIVVYSEELGKE